MGLFDTLFGSGGSDTKQTSTVQVAPEGAREQAAGATLDEQLAQLKQLVGAGANIGDVGAARSANLNLARELEKFASQGAQPSQAQIGQANQFAQNIFAGEEAAIRGGFDEQNQRVAQLAAQLGRPVNDPILQAKLAQQQTRQLGELAGRRTAFAAQEAQAAPQRLFQTMGQLSDVRGGLASQAFANRQALFSLGQALKSQEQQFRLNTATRTTNQRQDQDPGGLVDIISGIGSIASVGAKAFTGASNLFGSSGSLVSKGEGGAINPAGSVSSNFSRSNSFRSPMMMP